MIKQIIFILFIGLSFVNCKETRQEIKQEVVLEYGSSAFIETEEVWICESPNAYAYHNNEYCSGFRKCTHSTALLPLSKIQQNHGKQYRPCRRCYKH